MCASNNVLSNTFAALDFLFPHKINIASGNSITILELINKLRVEFPDYRGAVEFDMARSGDIVNSNADCKKMNYLLK